MLHFWWQKKGGELMSQLKIIKNADRFLLQKAISRLGVAQGVAMPSSW